MLSAFIVAGIYGYRWLTGAKPEEKLTPQSLVGYKQPLTSPEGFLVAWALVYFMLAALSAFTPGLAGALALLVLLADVLANAAGAAQGAVNLQKSKTRKEPVAKRH